MSRVESRHGTITLREPTRSAALRMTPLQQRILAALSRASELSNAQVAERAGCSEAYASVVLNKLEANGVDVSSRMAQDEDDPQTHYRMWRRGKV